jgi:hypothetical protein
MISTKPDVNVELIFVPKVNQKTSKTIFNFKDVLVKGVSAQPRKISTRGIKKHTVKD